MSPMLNKHCSAEQASKTKKKLIVLQWLNHSIIRHNIFRNIEEKCVHGSVRGVAIQ